MSEDQERRHLERFPFLEKNESVVLSSVFDEDFFSYVNKVNADNEDLEPVFGLNYGLYKLK